jgi:hypothetical protein
MLLLPDCFLIYLEAKNPIHSIRKGVFCSCFLCSLDFWNTQRVRVCDDLCCECADVLFRNLHPHFSSPALRAISQKTKEQRKQPGRIRQYVTETGFFCFLIVDLDQEAIRKQALDQEAK